MSMFCYQCQEALGNKGCTVNGVCGKPADVANLQDLLIYALKGLVIFRSTASLEVRKQYADTCNELDDFIVGMLFSTITNANFDRDFFVKAIKETIKMRDMGKEKVAEMGIKDIKFADHDAASFTITDENVDAKAQQVGVLQTDNEDIRSLRELLTYGLKGIAAYAHHARQLGKEIKEIVMFTEKALIATLDDGLSADDLVKLVLECGKVAVDTMAVLDAANTETYGNPEITEVNIGVRNNPAILISGHDLKDMEELLKQTEGTGVDVYTHSEMLPANYYPAFKKYEHFVGNYGNAWWKQDKEFASFNGPILMTTNCITPVKDSYKDRIFTTGMAGYPGVPHIARPEKGEAKDFSEIIELAKTCDPPIEIETGKIVGGFAHNQVIALADKVVDAVKSGAIKRFIVMAGCDGRHKTRDYFTEVAEELPQDTVILTAGCAKYRYNKLDLGDIGGIPRVLDAGQCNDSYSLAVIALKLKEVFGLDDINDLPISFDIAWYEQKAVTVLLALLYLGVKGIRLGPTLPAFLSPNVAKVLVENFDIKPIGEVQADVAAMTAGK
ncbi:MAG: hydroxylamine reductase [Candidatus Cloacimonetes bacterium]|nr:hydroxylamine reductase [Candidatus Cloacimonadota bacterium]MCF7812998.1 hydroxylamine reductase [Candidatus Cloacimonadota bacterium]MCF7867270.1 hydroxylamine reductase [Candidatus Cloacimonadota bacterium]MCF7882714.1 hydroxylamine reductase [Candidatus Cloacimonadota bacterium]